MSGTASLPRNGETFWFVARGSVLKGPYTSEELEKALKAKEIAFVDFCWRSGFREWRPISAVNEFERRGRGEVPAYPTVEVPFGGADSSPYQVNRYGDRRQNRSTGGRRVQLTLAKNRRFAAWSVYQWAGSVLFAVLLAFIGVNFALSEVEDRLGLQVELMALGHPQTFGSHTHNYLPESWSPLFSAPGFKEVPLALQNIPVKVQGNPSRSPAGGLSVGAYKVEANAVTELWQAKDHNADPVYLNPVSVYGYLSIRDAGKILLAHPGEPLRVQALRGSDPRVLP